MSHYCTTLKYRLEITDIELANKRGYNFATECELFFTLNDVWQKLVFKLKRERCGYSGIKGNTLYTVIKIA